MLLPSVILMTTDNIVDRDELQSAYVDRVIDSMDIKTMAQIISDQLHENLDNYSVNELINEVEEYYPDLLEDELSEGR
jgi:flagellar biosynthesis component FlhA